MKKTILSLLALLFFTSCGTQEKQVELDASILYIDEDLQDEVTKEEQTIEIPKENKQIKTETITKKQITYQAPSSETKELKEEKIDTDCSLKINNPERSDCLQDLQYEHEDAKWQATNAGPISPTNPYEYSGTAKLRGWVVDMVIYGNEDLGPKYPHFHVIEESRPNLPPLFQNKYQNYDISNNSPSILEELKQFGPKNPATITVNRIRARWEGAPQLNIIEVN